jgi:hypothetical protein
VLDALMRERSVTRAGEPIVYSGTRLRIVVAL